jgi:hypothetical protein
MITQETAQRIWNCYREIEVSMKLLSDIEETRKDERIDKYSPTLRDVFGRQRHLELGVPCGQDGHRLFKVAPQLAESVIRAHIANKEAELSEAQEQARIELSD